MNATEYGFQTLEATEIQSYVAVAEANIAEDFGNSFLLEYS